MAFFRYLYGLSFLLLLGCNATTQEEPTPSYNKSRVYIHYKIEGTGTEGYTIDMKTYRHAKPDSTFERYHFSYIGAYDKSVLTLIDKQTDVSAELLILPCGNVPRNLPVGATVLIEIIVDGKLLKSSFFESTATASTPPITSVKLTCLER